VHRLATEAALAGWVRNSLSGVELEVEGPEPQLRSFLDRLARDPPLPAHVEAVAVESLAPVRERGFQIHPSVIVGGAARPRLLPDLAPCADCRRELFDEAARRFRHPFASCTRCGPRFTIVRRLPYDRAHTSLADFPLCAACRAEYIDPADRRFHAQPISCPACGPSLVLTDAAGHVLGRSDAALRAAEEALRAGQIVALKGVGGFQLLVDARDQEAVNELRRRKRRPEKPFALLAASLEAARDIAVVSLEEAELLGSPAAPIVLLKARPSVVTSAVAPDRLTVGVMLPASPLHHLIAVDLGFPLVATSGNLAEEPLCFDNDEARARLRGIADLFLMHDRPIVRPIDDSVARVIDGRLQLLRAARGYAPLYVPIAFDGPPILATGGHQKNAVGLVARGTAVLSQHVGDLGSPLGEAASRRVAADLLALHDAAFDRVACDQHPDYASTRIAEELGRPLERVQHHLAHALAMKAEHAERGPLLAVIWDGTGAGPDGTVWGGEFLTHDGQRRWRRVAHLRTFRLPGGDAAARETFRAAAGLLAELGLPPRPPADWSASDAEVLRRMLAHGLLAPRTSSAGRLFDGVASLLGLCQRQSYEGQAASRLEQAVPHGACAEPYPIAVETRHPAIIDWAPLVCAILAALDDAVSVENIAARFHETLALAIDEVARVIGQPTVLLGGGCFQNRVLTERTCARLRASGFAVRIAGRVPPNDGGLALGQLIAAAMGHVLEED
jgi:hydrogenase maturation protein HypF